MTDVATNPPPVETPDPQPEGAGSPPKPATKKVLLKDLGPTLPLGIADASGVLHREIECRRWRGAEEREAGRLQADSKERGDFVSRLMAFMYTRIGEHNLDDMKDAEKQVILSKMYMGDVFYMYVWLRTRCLGTSLKMDLTCPRPRCPDTFPFDADLNTLEVRTADSLDAVKWSYDLHEPFDLRGGQAQGFELGPIRWVAMEEVIRKALKNSDQGDPGMAKMDTIFNCIQSVKGVDPLVMIPRELDELGKIDIEMLSNKIDEHEVGPDMSVEEKCPRCKRTFRTSLDWGYESFFGVSSPS